MKYKYTIDDLLLDVQHHTVIDRQPFASYVFALGHGALRKESATLRFTTRQLLDHLALAGAFGPEDTIELDGNALSDEEVANFLRTFLPSKRRLPSIDLTGNPLGKKTVDAIKAIVSMERSFMPPFPPLPLRFILLYDTLIDLDSMEELKSYHGGSVVPQVLPIPDRVMLLAAEQALQDVQRPTSRSCSPDRVGQWIWAGFLTPTILTDNRDVVIRLYKKDAQAQDYIQDVSRIVFTLAIRSLSMDSITFSHVDSREELRLIRDALLPTSVSYVEFRQFTPPQKEEVQGTMQSFLEDIRSLQCILWVDPSSEEDQGCFRSSAKQWMRRQKESFVLREEHLRHPPLVEAAHCRMWLTNPAIPLSLHQIPQKMLALPSLMAMLSMQSNVQRLSFAYAKVTLAQLQTLLESLPPPPCCCVKEIDLRQTNLFASELWNTIRRYPHLHFEYEAQRVPLVRGLRLTHNAAKKIEVVKENNLSFQAAVLSLKERQQSQRQQSGTDAFLQFHQDMTDAQLAASLASYVEQVGHLPAMVDLTNLDAEKEVLSFLAQYVYTLIETEMEVPRTAFFLSNTRLPIAGIRALPAHRALSFFPKMIPSSVLSFRDIVLDEQTIVPFIEGGGTDAAVFQWVACNKLLSASPGMFSTSIMYSIFFRILATRSNPPLRAIALVDRSCSTMRLSEVARLMVQHLKSVEYVLVAELRKWEVDMRISHHASEEANDVNVNRMVMASVQLLAGSLPLLRQVDVFPYKGKYRPATFQFVAHVQEAVLQSYGLHVSYLHRLPNYVGFCGGAVHGRIRPGSDNLLLYSDQVSLPFSPEEVIELMSRRGHGQQALSFAMKGADVNDNTLMSLYLSAVEPLEMVDFSGTAVTMTGIKLIADHPEVESTIRTLHFANIPHLMRLNHMKDRPTLFHGISSTIQTPTSVMLERMRLAQSVVLNISCNNIGAKPRMEREATEGEDLQDIESGDDLLRFLRRVSLILRKTEFSHFLEGTSIKIGEDRFDWSHVPDTLHFTMDTIAVWKELSPVLFLSFFRFASLDRLVHRMIFEQGLAISDNLLLLFFTLPGSIEFVIEDPSSLTTSFLDAQWLAHFTTNHIVILYGQIVEKYRPNDRLAILQQGQEQEIRIVSSEGETALIRHLPYLMASRGNRVWISGMPMNVFLFMLMPESSLCFPHLHYLLLDNMKWNGSIERLGAEQILHVFPSLNNVVLTLEERRPAFDLHIATIFNRYRIRGQHPTFHWTNTEKGVLFTDVQQLMGETAILPRRFHLWLPKGRLHVPFPMDLLHYDRWVAVVKALKANFSNIVRIDLSSVMIAFDFFVNQPEVFEHIEEWDLSGTVLASDIAESVWSSMERVVHWRNKKNASTMVMLEEDQWDALQRSHPSLFTLLTRTSANKEVVVEETVDATGEQGLLPSDVDPQINETALETYHVLRDTLILSEDAKQAVATWSERSLVSVPSWKEVDVREWSVDAVLHALGHAVLDGLAAQQMKQKWTHATFSHPRLLYVTHGTPSSTIHLSSTGLLVILQLAGEGQYIRYAKGVVIEMRVGEWVVVPRAAIHPLGSTPMLLLALQLDLFVREESWEVVPSLQHNDLYNQMHRIEEQPMVPIQPPLPAFTPIPSDALPMDIVPTEEVPTSMAWRNDVEAALTSLYSFLMEPGHGTPFVSMWYMKESNEKVLWIGFYANQSVHVRFIAFEHVKPVERKISTFKSSIKKQMEHSIAFTTPIHSPNNVVFTIHNPVLQMNKFSLMLPKSNIRSVGMETFESKWELDYPYATSSTPTPPEVIVVPPPPSPEGMPTSPISFASPLSFLEEHGYVYEDYLGKGATAYVVRVRQLNGGKKFAAKLFMDRLPMESEVQHYKDIHRPALNDILIHLEQEWFFPRGGLSMQQVIGVVGAQRIPGSSSLTMNGGIMLLTLMDGSLFSEGVVPSWHVARFMLLLQTTPSWMEELWAWMEQAETAMVAAHIQHGDPGLRNILFHWDERTGERSYRLGDFGLSKANASEQVIRQEWGLFRNFAEKLKRRFIPVDRYKHEAWEKVTVTYDKEEGQLWIAESQPPASSSSPHVYLYDHLFLNPPPAWTEQWMEMLDMTIIPAQKTMTLRTPERFDFQGVSEVRLYVVAYDVPLDVEESESEEEEKDDANRQVIKNNAFKSLMSPSHPSYLLAGAPDSRHLPGEITVGGLDKLFEAMNVTSSDVFGDIGAGRGNVVYYAWIKHNMKAYGWEIADDQFEKFLMMQQTIQRTIHLLPENDSWRQKESIVYHEGVKENGGTNFDQCTIFYAFDARMNPAVRDLIEISLNNQKRWRYFASTAGDYANLNNAIITHKIPVKMRGSGQGFTMHLYSRQIEPLQLPPNRRAVDEKEDTTMSTTPDTTPWKTFVLNNKETRTPLMKVLTGEPEIRIGFMDDQEMFEYVTIHFPNFKAEKAKTAARSLQDNVRDFFAKESNIQVESVSVDQNMFLASFTYDGGKSKVFRVESVGIVVEEQRKQVQEEKKKSKRKNLSALGYAFEKTLDVGQESIVVLASKEGKRYAIKLFRESLNFEEYRRPSFLNDQIMLNNFFETEQDAYLAIQQVEAFTRLKPLVLGYVEGQPLSPSIKASTFVGQPTGEKEVLIVGYLVLDYMDNDLNLERKKRRSDWDVLFDLRTRGMVAFESFLNEVQTAMESLHVAHLDLHLYNVFYQRKENGLFDFRLGDLATMRYNQHSVLEEEEWARLRKEVEGIMEPTKMIAQETIQQQGKIAYDADQEAMVLEYATATFETRLYVYPLTLKETPSFLSKEGEEVTFGAVLKEEGGRIAQSFELTFVKEDGEKTTIRIPEKQMAQAGIYKFEQPTEQTVKKAKEAEVIPSTKMAVYKPVGGKYDTSRWSAVMAPFNELIQDKEHEWTVTMERDAEDPSVLKMIVNELTVVTLKGLLSSRIDKLLAKPYLSIESIEVIHVHRSYLVRVEMRVKKQDKKWRIRFRLKVPDMSLFDVTLNESSLTYLKEHPVDKKVEGANVILLTDDDPMVFSHALDSSVTIGQKHDLYEKELRNRQGKTVYQVFSVNGRGFLLEDVRLAVLSPSGQSRFTTDIAEANLFILLTTEVDRSYVELRRVAFGVFQFSHDADMKNKLIVVNEKSVKITRYDFMYRFFSKGMIVEFESIPENAQGYGAFNYYEDVPDSVVQTVYFLPWFNDGALLSFVSIPAPPTEDPLLLNRFYELLEEHRHATSGIVKEETEEAEDEYAEALREGLEEEEEHSSLSSQSEDGLIVVEGQEEATKEVSEFLEFAKLKATKTNRLQAVNPLLRTSLSFSSSAMSYSKTTKTMTFHKWVNEQEEVFRFVLNNVDDKDTFSSAVADAFEQTSLLDAITNARYNHGSIGWKIVSKYNNVKGWKAVVTIEDTWSGIRAFVHALLPKIIASEDRNPAHLWTFGLLEARHALERTFMECEGEECTAILLRRMKMAFPDLALGNTVEEQMNVLKVAGVIEEGNAAGLFLSLAWKDRIEQAILSQDAAMMDAAVLLLIVIHEKVAADASMTEVRGRAFFESFQQLFPTQWTLTELQSLNKMYDVQYGGIILPLSRDDLPKKTFVSKRSLQTLTQQVNKEGLEVVTLTFHPTS